MTEQRNTLDVHHVSIRPDGPGWFVITLKSDDSPIVLQQRLRWDVASGVSLDIRTRDGIVVFG